MVSLRLSIFLCSFALACLQSHVGAKSRVIPPVNPLDPERLPANETRRVLIVGGGLSGLSAALELSERGYAVHVTEQNASCGGDLQAVVLSLNGRQFRIPKMHHGFFTNFFQALDILDRLGGLMNVKNENTVTLAYFNLPRHTITTKHSSTIQHFLILWNAVFTQKCIDVSDVMHSEKLRYALAHFDYDSAKKLYSNMTFFDYAVGVKGVPKRFYDCLIRPAVSSSGYRPDRISAFDALTRIQIFFESSFDALRSVHLLGSNSTFMDTWIKELARRNTTFSLNYTVEVLAVNGSAGAIVGEVHDATTYDHVILAGSRRETERIMRATYEANTGAPLIKKPLLQALPVIGQMKDGPVTKIVKLFLINASLPTTAPDILTITGFIDVDRVVILNRFNSELNSWATKYNGSVLELHLTNWTRGKLDPKHTWAILRPQLVAIIPNLRGCILRGYREDNRDDLPNLGVPQPAVRPRTDFIKKLGISNLILAGSWIDTNDYPSVGVEKEISIGREAANHILLADRVRQALLVVPGSKGNAVWLPSVE